jgi:hypothetical protein
MTVPSNLNKHVYDGDGVTTTWPFTFPVTDEDHIELYVTEPDGTPELIDPSDYTVDLDNSEIEYPISGDPLPADGTRITVLRVVPLTQGTDYKNQGDFNSETVETALDKLTMIAQQHDEALNRAVKTNVDGTLPAESVASAAVSASQAAASAAAAAASADEAAVSADTAAENAAIVAPFTSDAAATLKVDAGSGTKKGVVANSGTSTGNILVANNGTSTGNVLECQDNGTPVVTVADGGATTLTATPGGSSVPLTVDNNDSTGSPLVVKDGGTAVLTVADGGTTTAKSNGGTNKALVANNGTSTGNILECQDNGTPVVTVADGGLTTLSKLAVTNSTRVLAYKSAADQVITADGSFQLVTFDAEAFDALGEWNTGTSIFTAAYAGDYLVSVAVECDNFTDSAGSLILNLQKNSAGTGWNFHREPVGSATSLALTTIVTLAAGDTLRVRFTKISGNNMEIDAGESSTRIAITRLY